MSTKPKYQRILLKLSGEALKGDRDFGIDPDFIGALARRVKAVHELGVQIGIVIGAGNIFRGAGDGAAHMNRSQADSVGMLGTIINSLMMQDALERAEVDTRVLSAVEMQRFCELYIRRRAIRHMEKGRVVICAGGTGNPFFTTDTAAALRAIEVGADIVLKATKVDGVFSADPNLDENAQMFDTLSYDNVIEGKLGVMDTNAIVLCRDQSMPIRVFNVFGSGNLMKIVKGEKVGTLVWDNV